MNRASAKSQEESADDATAVDATTGGERSERHGSGGDAAREHGGSEAGRLQNGNAAIGLGSRLPDGSNAERPNPLINRPGDRYEQEAERVADAVMASGFDRETSDGETENRIPTKGPSRRLTGTGPRIQRQDRGPQPDHDRRGQRRQGNQPQGNQPQGNQQQGNQQQGNQQAQQGGQNQQGDDRVGLDDLSDYDVSTFTAVVLAESAPGDSLPQDERASTTRQEDEIKWVYYHNVQELGFEAGLSQRSAAYDPDGTHDAGFKFWMTVLGEDTYRGEDPPPWPGAGGYDTMGAFVDQEAGPYRQRATYLRGEVEDMFEAPTQEERENFTGQGNLDDLNEENGESIYWRRTRQYYRIQEGIADAGPEPGELEEYVDVVEGDSPDSPTFIFQDSEIRDYFNNHPEHLPEDVPEVTLQQIDN
jgi:hypothetical protein